jgi:hypothetical protein
MYSRAAQPRRTRVAREMAPVPPEAPGAATEPVTGRCHSEGPPPCAANSAQKWPLVGDRRSVPYSAITLKLRTLRTTAALHSPTALLRRWWLSVVSITVLPSTSSLMSFPRTSTR